MVISIASGVVSALVMLSGFQAYDYASKKRVSAAMIFILGVVEGLVLCYGLQIIGDGIDASLTIFSLLIALFLGFFMTAMYQFESA